MSEQSLDTGLYKGKVKISDMNNDGKYYKHIIYSDVAGINGAKMVASSLIANEFSLIYKNGKFVNDLKKSYFIILYENKNYLGFIINLGISA